MNVDLIQKRLLRLDEDVFLNFGDKIKFKFYIIGGSALMILNCLPRVTYDIDVFSNVPQEIIDLMNKYDINMGAKAYMDNFADDFESRAKKLDWNTYVIDYYVLSVEDLVASKLASQRIKDLQDIENPDIVKLIDWNKLCDIINDIKINTLSDMDASLIEFRYNDYRERFENA